MSDLVLPLLQPLPIRIVWRVHQLVLLKSPVVDVEAVPEREAVVDVAAVVAGLEL